MTKKVISSLLILCSTLTNAGSAAAYETPTLSSTPINTNCGVFVDVKSDDPLCPAILYSYERNIFKGYNLQSYADGRVYFKPRQNINRAEVLKIALAAFINQDFSYQNVLAKDFKGKFSDIPADDNSQWWYPYLKYAADNRMIQGYADNSFRPTKFVSRSEFLKMFLYLSPSKTAIDRWVIKNENGLYVGLWKDTPRSAWYANYIAFANQNGLFAGFSNCPAGSICPDQAISRGEVALMIYNYHNYLKTDLGFLDNELMKGPCNDPYVLYLGQCVDPAPTCLRPVQNALFCTDLILKNGVRNERAMITCKEGYDWNGTTCSLK